MIALNLVFFSLRHKYIRFKQHLNDFIKFICQVHIFNLILTPKISIEVLNTIIKD